jgi:hypothetical protein
VHTIQKAKVVGPGKEIKIFKNYTIIVIDDNK